jgi:hypothetical protein
VFDLGDVKYAFEHTVVEAFPGQLRANEHFNRFVEPITAALDYQLPHGGYFQLSFPIDPSAGMKPAEVSRRQDEIIAWTKLSACDLAKEAMAAYPTARHRRMLPSVIMPGTDGTLLFHEDVIGGMGSRLMPTRVAPKNYERLRAARIQESVQRKLPKLALWRSKPAKTVFVVENRDGAISNHWLISDCLECALQGRSDVPDAVWLVDAVHAAFWVAICLREGTRTFPHEESMVPFREFKPSELSGS